MKVTSQTARELVEATVSERARHDTKDKVGDTRSFANMELTLTREYWGRFLIEMLQNARDAWLASSPDGMDGLVRIRLTTDPALVVCNEGEPLSADVVLHSISKFGESGKKYGEGIGHKGIGFKAVLELTLGPRIYSRSDASGSFELQIRFDPEEARQLIMDSSPDWDRLVAELASAQVDDPLRRRIPVLRFPLWEVSPPSWLDEVSRIEGRDFNTVISLPYDARFDSALEISRDDFVGRIRKAFDDVTDEVLLLLGVFGQVVVEDEIAGTTTEIRRTEEPMSPGAGGLSAKDVRITRNGALSSRWWLFERSLQGHEGLEGDLGVAVRVGSPAGDTLAVQAPVDEVRTAGSGDCFHLFFPTRIRTHLPFVFHAYFEVDAGRKSFAEAREKENHERLDGLRALSVDAVKYLVAHARAGAVDATDLAALFAQTSGDPDDPLASEFRDALLEDLDRVDWVATYGGSRPYASPKDLLVDDSAGLPALLPKAFPPTYLERRLGRSYPQTNNDRALEYLTERNAIARESDVAGLDAASLAALLRPLEGRIWDEDVDIGFRALLDVLDISRRDADISQVLDDVRSDPRAMFVPVIEQGDTRRLRAAGRQPAGGDDEDEDVAGAILARVSASTETPLAPPHSLGLDFLADGLITAELLPGIGARLGIRPYQTEVIIDAIATRPDGPDDALEYLRFVWRLLLRERGRYSLVNVVRGARTFEPGTWFWSKTNGNRTEQEREELRRSRALANLLVPSEYGAWRPATELAFGAEWADWLDARGDQLGPAAAERAAAYRDLQAIARGPEDLVAGPEAFANLLPLVEDDVPWAASESGPELPQDRADRHAFLIHALLLRLGVWEVPPIRGYVNYRFPRGEASPPWADNPEWAKVRRSHARRQNEFAQYGHKNIYVAEDYAFAWPLTPSDALVRALGRAASFYRGYRGAELFCPQCSGTGSGRSHSKRYSTDYDSSFQSFALWQLRHDAWIPTTIWGTDPKPLPATDAWFEDERPDEAHMQQSWMRFLPLATTSLGSDLAALANVRRLGEADLARVRRQLRSLRERFDGGEVDPDGRASSFASQAFASLHWRLYERVATFDQTAAREALEEVGALAILGRRLVYASPGQARHDDGTFAQYRRYFTTSLPIMVTTREQGPTADVLGVDRFRVEVERVDGGKEVDVTDEIREFLHDRAAELLALQVYHPIGARPLQLDGQEFPRRAERLRRLQVVRVNDLVLRVIATGTDLVREIGAGGSEDLYLDTSGAAPKLYFDVGGTRWQSRFRALAGPYVAELLENAAYGATFQLLMQAETEAEVEDFLESQAVSAEDVGLVRSQIDAISGVLRAEEARWWSVLLPTLGLEIPDGRDVETYRRKLVGVLQGISSPVPEFAIRLLRAGGGEAARSDTSRDGALAAIEAHGVDLQTYHELLVENGDQGLRAQASAQRLSEWIRSHGAEVSAVLASRGVPAESAKSTPATWRLPATDAYRIAAEADVYLAPVVETLRSTGLEVEPSRLMDVDASAYIAGLIGLSEEDLFTSWHGLFDEDERGRLDHERAAAWRRVLRPILVSARTRPGDQPHVIRAAAERVDASLPSSPSHADDLASHVALELATNTELGEFLQGAMRGSTSLAQPTIDALRDDLGAFLDLEHVDRVMSILQRGRRQAVDQLRQDIVDLRDRQITPTPFAGAEPVASRKPKKPRQRTVVGARRLIDQRLRDRLGAKGERVALAAVLDAIQKLSREEQDAVVSDLVELLTGVATGDVVDRLVGDARAAQDSIDEDDRIESMARFLHVARASDDFGFDLLGYLPAYQGSDPRPLLLEVKNSSNRRFIASAAEWRRAEEQGDDYAFFVVLRGTGDAPVGMELVPNPAVLLSGNQISREEDAWVVAYKPLDARGAGN